MEQIKVPTQHKHHNEGLTLGKRPDAPRDLDSNRSSNINTCLLKYHERHTSHRPFYSTQPVEARYSYRSMHIYYYSSPTKDQLPSLFAIEIPARELHKRVGHFYFFFHVGSHPIVTCGLRNNPSYFLSLREEITKVASCTEYFRPIRMVDSLYVTGGGVILQNSITLQVHR